MIKALLFITPSQFLFSVAILSFITAFCQENISGLVIDTDHQPIDGAYISVKKSGVGTITETNGRFFLKAKTGDVLPALTPETLLDERGRELWWESWRRQDLIRVKMFQLPFRGKNYIIDPKYLIYPIPAEQLAINPNLVQNPGY
jgi:hypothetical protein